MPNDRVAQGAAANDGIAIARLRIQRKSWRCRLTLTEPKRRLKVALFAWLAPPVERLQSELAWVDGCSRAFYDIVFQDAINPVVKCRRSLAALLHYGPDGPLKPV